MRWPWSREPAQKSAPADRSQSAASGAVPAEPAPSPMGWAFLPPIQRSLDTPLAPITRPTAFPADLPAWRSPAFTSTLSHAVVDTVPGGVVDGDGGGLGEPSYAVGAAPELTLLPPPRPKAVQRVATDPGPAVVEEPALVVEAEVPADEVEAPEPAADAAVAEPQAGAREPGVVRPEAPAPTLTRATSVGLPVVQRSVATEPPPVEQTDPSPAPADVVPDDLPERPALTPTSDTSTSTPPSPKQTASAPPPPVVQRTDGPSGSPASPAPPRLGLGAPLAHTPRTAVPTPPELRESAAMPRESVEISGESVDVPVEPAGPDGQNAGFAGDTGGFASNDDGLATHDDGFGGDFSRLAEQGFTEVPIQRAVASPVVPSSSSPRPVAGPVPEPAPESGRATVQPAGEPPAAELILARSVEPGAEPPHSPPASPASGPPAAAVPETAPVAEDGSAGESADVVPTSGDGARPAVEVDRTEADPIAEEPAAATPDVYVEPPPASLPSAPLPLATGISTSIQRAHLLPGPGDPRPSLVVQPAPLVPSKPSRERVVPIQRLPAGAAPSTSEPAPGRQVAGRASTARGAVGPVQRAASISENEPPPTTATVEDTGPFHGNASPVPTGPVVSHAAAPGPAVAVQRAATSTVPFRSPPALAALPPSLSTRPDRLGEGATAPAPVTVQAVAESEPIDAAAHTDDAGVGTSAPVPVTVQTAVAPPPASTSAGPATAPGKGPGSATGDVDALAQKLFPAVLRRIKSELLLDRERRGVRTDPW